MGPLRVVHQSAAWRGTRADGERCSPGHEVSGGDDAWTLGEVADASSRYTTGNRADDLGRSGNRSRKAARSSGNAAHEGQGPRSTPSQPPEPDLWTTAFRLCEAYSVLGVASPLTGRRNATQTPAATGVFPFGRLPRA